MNRLHASLLFLFVGIGALVAIGATATPIPQQPDFSGKVVIFDYDGWTSTVSENVRLAVIGNDSFLIFTRPKSDKEQYDHWLPLNKISSIKVFDKLEDAIAHDKKSSPFKYRDENASK